MEHISSCANVEKNMALYTAIAKTRQSFQGSDIQPALPIQNSMDRLSALSQDHAPNSALVCLQKPPPSHVFLLSTRPITFFFNN